MNKVYLVITIDTEEDQWGITREEPTTNNINALKQLQKLFDDYGVLPTYLVNWPVVDSDVAVEILSGFYQKEKLK